MIRIRLATPDDLRFVASSWFESYLKLKEFEFDDFDIYRVGMNARIERLLARCDVRVAFYESVPDEVLGYAVVEGDALFWVYVKSTYRKLGIGTGLLGGTVKRYATSPRKLWAREWFAKLGAVRDPKLLEIK